MADSLQLIAVVCVITLFSFFNSVFSFLCAWNVLGSVLPILKLKSQVNAFCWASSASTSTSLGPTDVRRSASGRIDASQFSSSRCAFGEPNCRMTLFPLLCGRCRRSLYSCKPHTRRFAHFPALTPVSLNDKFRIFARIARLCSLYRALPCPSNLQWIKLVYLLHALAPPPWLETRTILGERFESPAGKCHDCRDMIVVIPMPPCWFRTK